MMNKMNPLVFLFCFLLFSCGEDLKPGLRESTADSVHGLGLMTVQTTALSQGGALVGTVRSSDRGVLLARIDGRVERIQVKPGDRVKAGELLLVISENTALQGLRAAKAAVTMARSSLSSARANLDMVTRDFERYQKLYRKEAVTPQEMERISAQTEVARQQLKAAKAELNRVESSRASAQMNLSYNEVKAPYAARVISREVEQGSNLMPGTPLLTLDREAGWEVETALPETAAGAYTVGEELGVWVPALNRKFKGRITEISAASDPQNRSFPLRLALEDGKDLRAGLFARIFLKDQLLSTLLVPTTALVERGQLFGLFVVDKDIVRLRLVKTGRRVGEQTEILSGLNPGDVIVVDGLEKVRPGLRVEDS